jgi:hypothetical protein
MAHLTNGLNDLPRKKVQEVTEMAIHQDPHPWVTMNLSKLPGYRDTRKEDNPVFVKDLEEYTSELEQLTEDNGIPRPSIGWKIKSVYNTRHEVESEIVNRVTSFYSLHPSNNKLSAKSKPRIGSIVLAVRKVIKELLTRWKSVYPMAPEKVIVSLDNRLDNTVLPDFQLDEILFYSMVPDRYLSNSLKNVTPKQRLSFFIRRDPEDRDRFYSENAIDTSNLLSTWLEKHKVKSPKRLSKHKSKLKTSKHTQKEKAVGLNQIRNKTISRKPIRKLERLEREYNDLVSQNLHHQVKTRRRKKSNSGGITFRK